MRVQASCRIMTKYQVSGNKKWGTAPFFQSAEFRVQSAVFVRTILFFVIPWRGAPAKTNVFVGCILTPESR